ncbi:MAG: mycothione reductase [Brachybacterium sp.]|nr:mycothione reductase [Brachybacterium sp.]
MTETTHFDIALSGSGSANSFPGPEFADRSIVQIDRGVGPDHVFGGTCINLGCIPTKMFVHTANLAHTPADATRFGLTEQLRHVDWPAIRDRIFGRIDAISVGGQEYRRDHEDNANLTLLRGTARFVGSKTLQVSGHHGEGAGDRRISADTIVLGAGSRPVLPPIEGLAEAAPHTSDTIMRIDRLPTSLAILGSGVIAVEMAHIFASLGGAVTLIARSQQVLSSADADVSARLTEILGERLRLVKGLDTTSVRRTADGVELRGEQDGAEVLIRAEALLGAGGRRPNAELLDGPAAGIDTAPDGRVEVDAQQRVRGDGTVLEGLWAFGDLSSPLQLKHVANHEQRIVRHNILHPEQPRRSDTMPVPSGVFTHPQVAWVGMTEETARAGGREVKVAVQEYASIAYGWAMEDTTGFAKLIVDAQTTEILGAHLIGPEATTLVQLLIQAMSTGQSARDIAATQYWIHPAMPELIENALLQVV